MRDHTKLKAFALADGLALKVYLSTREFPREEQYGLTSQMRRAAVSIASNIVEGCARHGESEYLHFLSIAYSSARELEYQASLARRLEYRAGTIEQDSAEVARVLRALIQSIRYPET